jgi:hypothetical protein
MLADWEIQAAAGTSLDLAAAMMRLTLTVVGHALFSVDLSASASDVAASLTYLLSDTERRIYSQFPLPLSIPTRETYATGRPSPRWMAM